MNTSGAGGRIRTDVGKAYGLQDRSNRPLWDTSIFVSTFYITMLIYLFSATSRVSYRPL